MCAGWSTDGGLQLHLQAALLPLAELQGWLVSFGVGLGCARVKMRMVGVLSLLCWDLG